MSETDAIDSKKKQNNDEDDNVASEKKESNWTTFGYSCLFGVFMAIITWLIASNIVFFTRIGDEALAKIFPKDPSKTPYEPDDDSARVEKCDDTGMIEVDGNNIDPWAYKLPETLPSVPKKSDAGALGNLAGAALSAAESSPQLQAAEAAAAALGVPGPEAAAALAQKAVLGAPIEMEDLSEKPDLPPISSDIKSNTDPMPTRGPGKRGGGIVDKIANLTKDAAKKLTKDTTIKFKFPYTWMNPFNDCAPDDENRGKFYTGKDKANNAYKSDGKISDKTDIYDNWKDAVAKRIKVLKPMQEELETRRNEITAINPNDPGLATIKKELTKVKAAINYLKPGWKYFPWPMWSGRWWSQSASNIKNWIATSTQYSFITERRVLQYIFKKLKPLMSGQNAASDQNPAQQEENSYLYGLFAMILNIIITYLIIHSSMAIGTFVNIWAQISGAKYTKYETTEEGGKYEKTSNWGRGIKYTIIGMCFGMLNFMWSFGVGIIQYIEIMYKFLMYPIINNFSEWKDNVQITAKFLPILYGMLITMAAWTSLEPIYGNTMFITMIVYIIKTNKSNNNEIAKAKKGQT
jgi:hypothetical protein